jgi:hypothetical protein
MRVALLSTEELRLLIELCSSSLLSRTIFVFVRILDANSPRNIPIRYQQSATFYLLVLDFRTDDADCVFGCGKSAIGPRSIDLRELSAEKKYLR